VRVESGVISLVETVRSLALNVRDAAERWLHPRRRRAAMERLRRFGLPESLLFVCKGNVCRSPYAAGAFQKLCTARIGRMLRIDSAGFAGPGRASPPTAVAAAAARGLDLSAHRSRPLTAGRVNAASLVIVMDGEQASAVRRRFGVPDDRIVYLGDLDSAPIERREIEDPMDKPRSVFDAVYARIDRCLEAWLSALFEHGPR